MAEVAACLTTGQAAARLGVTAEWVRRLCAEGRLAHERTPLGRLIHVDAVERYRREREARQTNGK